MNGIKDNSLATTSHEVITPASFTPSASAQSTSRKRPPIWLLALSILLLVFFLFVWFTVTARSVQLSPDPADAHVNASGLHISLGGYRLYRPGTYAVEFSAPGYESLSTEFTVSNAQSQSFSFQLQPLPGRVQIDSNPAGAQVEINGNAAGTTTTDYLTVPAGEAQLTINLPRYRSLSQQLQIQGREQEQRFEFTLEPAWAEVTFRSEPAGAGIYIDNELRATTPATIEVIEGQRHVAFKLEQHKTWESDLEVSAGTSMVLPDVTLQLARGLIRFTSEPERANVQINGKFAGRTPFETELEPKQRYRVSASKPGYRETTTSVTPKAAGELNKHLQLTVLTGSLSVDGSPANARIFINGKDAGAVGQTFELPVQRYELEVRAKGFASLKRSVTPRPGFPQKIAANLLTVAQARAAAVQPRYRNREGMEMVLLEPGTFTMGASRREPGRRTNEVLREVRLTRAFYLASTEVSNAQYRRFSSEHNSGEYEGVTLNEDTQPAANVSWLDAVRYCNWLSAKQSLPPYYRIDGDQVTIPNETGTGYRLPTEAEWAWAARTAGEQGSAAPLKFPWGDTRRPPERHGNYADRTAANLVGRIIFDYVDGYAVSAPIGTYTANAYGLKDLGGNVAEWTGDYYEIPTPETQVDPVGPSQGDYYVIRGSSWQHGTVTDLRFSFRDYGTDARSDLGLRVAQTAPVP